ncbi:MAG: oxygen-insensitive NADPH nitroreductase [Vibrio sp.]
MNDVINTLTNHRSIRSYTDEKISPEMLETIIAAGLAASSSSFLQTTSIIRVTDAAKRAQLAQLAGGQSYVETAAEFLVFCIDYHRHKTLSKDVQTDFTELALIGAIDTGIMAQNVMTAAESLGLGGVYIGGLRNHPNEVDDLLGLPQDCAILFGMCLGYPAQDPQIKPRLPQSVILHQDTYQAPTAEDLAQYDETTINYYQGRGSNTKSTPWTEQVIGRLGQESRPFIKSYLHKKGLALK